MKWNIQRKGRTWKGNEANEKIYLLPEKFETYKGKLFYSEKERINTLAILLEHVGIDKAFELCNISDIEKSVEKIKKKKKR